MIIHDAVLLARLHAASFAGSDPWGSRAWSDGWTADAMAALLATPGTFATLSPGASGLALVRVAADEAELITLAILPEARRRGLARALLRDIMGESHDRGARHLFLEVSERNDAARALYGQAGFLGCGRRRRYYPDGSDALVMAARLEAPCGSGPA